MEEVVRMTDDKEKVIELAVDETSPLLPTQIRIEPDYNLTVPQPSKSAGRQKSASWWDYADS